MTIRLRRFTTTTTTRRHDTFIKWCRGAVVSSCIAGGILVTSVRPQTNEAIALRAGMVITSSVTIRPTTYRLASADLTNPVVTVRGDNITIDFNGAILTGGPDGADPDTYAGVGVLIDGGSKVTLKNAVIRGYKVGILARNSPDLHLTRNDVSYNWKQRLYSGIEKESLVDWMSYHQNEKDEWLRFGAGIYLRSCDRAEIDHTTALQGQNGLMVTHSSGLKIWNNRFQFLSSIGVGLYRVSQSTIMHNRIDWCVRGYSHGFYNRGQDSAGLLMYEQSSNNVVAYNSVTHGGDGLFLWAGQTTMDTGQGGANDNLFYKNDFSHAPTNGIEATFSRNTFLNNRVEENWHGVWGGYSYDSWWGGNSFVRNTEGIAIEHGQGNRIHGNTFDGDETAIRLWSNATQDPNWGYPKNRDTASRDFSLQQNTFKGNKVAMKVDRTKRVLVRDNKFDQVGTEIAAGDGAEDVGPDARIKLKDSNHQLVLPGPLDGGNDAMIKAGERRGRNTIIVDEWGPYDWKSPKLWPAGKSDDEPLKLRVLGPTGTWKVKSVRGATVAPSSGHVGAEIVVTPRAGPVTDYDVALEYRGASVTSPRGAVTKAGAPFTFRYTRFSAPANWTVRFFEYTDASDPVKQPQMFVELLRGAPLKTVKLARLDYMSGRTIEEGVPRDRFAFAADGSVDLPPGDYTLRVISDDGVRVWVDDNLALDAWEPHESKADEVLLRGGRHRLKVHYFEVGGWAEMRLDIQPRRMVK